MLLLVLISLSAVAFLLYTALVAKGRRRGDPPTPGWLPVVGSLPYLQAEIEVTLGSHPLNTEPVVVLHYGLERVYCLNTYEAAREALVNQGDKFLHRPDTLLKLMLDGEAGGIVFASGRQWREYRRFALKTLRDLGFGRRGGEQVVSAEAAAMCNRINSQDGVGIDTGELFSPAISNIICQLVFGSRVAEEEAVKFKELLDLMQALLQSQNNRNRNFTLLLHMRHCSWLPQLQRLIMRFLRRQSGAYLQLVDYCKQQAEQHRLLLQQQQQPEQEPPGNFIDAHIQHQAKLGESPFTDTRLSLSIVDLFVAGTDTTAHTLRWAVLQMIDNPSCERRAFKEISSVIGLERSVTMLDKASMPYTQAVLEEVHRLASLATTGVPHQSTEAASVCGQHIPAGSTVIYNIYNIHRCSRDFPQPDRFNPDRFLDSEGRFRPSERVVPFGIGKRACLGESLARMELFIFFVTLLQRYTLGLEPGDTRSLPDIMTKSSPASGMRTPQPYRVVFTQRAA